ncbi:MAG: hypothetical protein M3O36_12275 [Myxococcota bacterium]|nr:hypothetical protein [Myxococcota bacterium]
MMRAKGMKTASLAAAGVATLSSYAFAQYPPPPPQQPYQPVPQQPYPPAPQQQPYQPVPPQPYPPPPPQQPYPPPYQTPYVPGQPPPAITPYPASPTLALSPPSRYRSNGEMAYLYGASLAYGIGTGVWIDALGKVSDPGIAFLAPLAFGAAVPIGMYIWDQSSEFDRSVPSSMATGLLLGGVEGIAISGLQWQLTGNGGPNSWDFPAWTTATFLTATAGGIGGYAFGEWFQPDPRSLALITSGAGWGAISGVLFGAGVVGGDWKDGAAVWGFAGYNAGILATGAVSTVYVPSWQTIKYMWLGDLLGTLATTPVYLFYIGSSADPRHGLIANAFGGLAGIALAAALTANMTDTPGTAAWVPPFQVGVGPTEHGGAQLTAYGRF